MTIHQLHPHGQPMPVSWQERLAAATTEAEVMHIARNFLAQFSPFEIAQLPEPCRPRKLVDGNDLTEYAFDLVRHRCDDGVGAEYAAHRLSSFFSGATARLSQILHERSRREAGSDQQSA
jgi:hypothetical protein